MKIREITDIIERFAPLSLQEDYDNSGLIVGRPDDEVRGVLLAVDVTEEVLDEAEAEGCDMIVTHHPIVFHPLKRFNSGSYVERCVERAIRGGIALYACHTNLDSTYQGMSWRLASMFGIEDLRVLEHSDAAVEIGYGVIGNLPSAVPTLDFLRRVSEVAGVECIRYSDIATASVRRVAVCTGSGSSFIGSAIACGAELYITADLKYNDFMTPSGMLTVADIGHFESEYCAIRILFEVLSKKL
ncbi:MAG: Nif3-like dinuclear metal center hexameric protein, partial [Alistipes sp.]|nr:Nif3-like dinuclear metal center hexameric protein [Alistipes sp.]